MNPQILIFQLNAIKHAQLHENTSEYDINTQNNSILGVKYIFWANLWVMASRENFRKNGDQRVNRPCHH